MDVCRSARESVAYTSATLAKKWSRYLIFVLLGLPWTILSSIAVTRKIIEGTVIHWNLIPWQDAGLLIGAGLLCNFIQAGYIVRLLKGDPVPPEFDRLPLLILDGIKIQVIPLAWMLAPMVLAFLQYLIASAGPVTASRWGGIPGTVLILLLLALQILILFFALQYAVVGGILFARTGSVREGFALIRIRATLGRIGLLHYFLGMSVLTAVWLIFSLALNLLSYVNVFGSVVAFGLGPFVTVFCFRFMAHVCDDDPGLAAGAAGMVNIVPPSLPPGRLIAETVAWFVLFAVLVFLCFTPLVLIAGSFGRFFP